MKKMAGLKDDVQKLCIHKYVTKECQTCIALSY